MAVTYAALVSTPPSSVSSETPVHSVSSFDHLVTQWMSTLTASLGRATARSSPFFVVSVDTGPIGSGPTGGALAPAAAVTQPLATTASAAARRRPAELIAAPPAAPAPSRAAARARARRRRLRSDPR